jgi:hypothetical protein
MTTELARNAMRVGWLTLAFMMLLSRIAFQAAGPGRMRAFLDRWQDGVVKRAWGCASLGFAVFLAAAAAVAGGLSTADAILLAALLAVLLADGLVNVLPRGFGAFKERLQREWVSRKAGSGREGDRHLFGTVNVALAAAAAAVAAVVVAYRPIGAGLVVLAAALALVLTAGLIAASSLGR